MMEKAVYKANALAVAISVVAPIGCTATYKIINVQTDALGAIKSHATGHANRYSLVGIHNDVSEFAGSSLMINKSDDSAELRTVGGAGLICGISLAGAAASAILTTLPSITDMASFVASGSLVIAGVSGFVAVSASQRSA